ncbi:hypothetical protein F0562_004705 [Nyssa sinensis]|uniref:Uncharacterized protein n=1 Tax=Nyssa sinensis TaxID=561372 RepID=A0A5J5BZE8_9ASTE|nr:hypothetical protein F0562_004705 [Nyssa sinensis]
MAVSSSLLPPILSPSGINTTTTTTTTNLVSSCPKLAFINVSSKSTNRRCPSVIVFSYKRKNGLPSDQKRDILESYGLNPDEFLSEPSPKVNLSPSLPLSLSLSLYIYIYIYIDTRAFDPPRETHKLLQVLGGKARRKKLLSPRGMDVRPMMEVVKAAAFGILQAAGGCPASLRSGRWLDLYSGTGSVGIEAISRGCSEVHFVEMDPWVVSNVLRPNLEWTEFLDVSVIHTVRVESFLEQADQFVGKDGPFDYLSVTPPYMEVDYGVLMDQISTSSLIGEDTFILVEYPLRTDMLDSCGCLIKIADRRFGRTHLAIYGPKWAQKKSKSERHFGQWQQKFDSVKGVRAILASLGLHGLVTLAFPGSLISIRRLNQPEAESD